MRIGCLQFAPQVGDVDTNLNRADAVLSRVDPAEMESLDLLVLPEMAFSGYNFKSKEQITTYVEPSGSGISSLWARTMALKHDCTVAVGYPERTRIPSGEEEFYNSLIVVNGDGETVANYRKTFLYYTDETWASEGDGFYQGEIQGLGQVAMGICMDLNSYKFQGPERAFEFGCHVLQAQANLVIVSMAWLTHEDARAFTSLPQEPDLDTLTYWVRRLEPVIRAEQEEEIIFVFANRCGIEGDTVYAGTSAVVGIQNGEVSVYGLLGRGTKELLIVDTEALPFAKLVNPDGMGASEEDVDTKSRRSSLTAASTQEKFTSSSGQKSPMTSLDSFPEDLASSDNKEEGRLEHSVPERSDTPAYTSASGVPSPRGFRLPREKPASTKVASGWGSKAAQDQRSPKQPTYRRAASPRDGYSPKVSPTFYRTASPRDGYSPRLACPREEYAPRVASPRDGYSPRMGSPRDGYSPRHGSPRDGRSPRNSPGIPSPRDWYTDGVPSPREFYRLKDDARFGAPDTAQGWVDDEPYVMSPTCPSPTPLSTRPKLAISTGPESLPPMSSRDPPRGVQPGNFFTSRDLCTPPETPFDYEPQPNIIQQYWAPPSAYMHTPEEPEWPETMPETDMRRQSPARRPSPANAPNKIDFSRTPARGLPTRPASRTQEVKLSDLDNQKDSSRYNDIQHSRHSSKSRTASRSRVPDRRPTPAIPERSVPPPRLRTKRSEPILRSQTPPSREGSGRGVRVPEPEVRRKESKGGPAQKVREEAFPWNSITIAASPSVFQTEFARADTFPRTDHHKGLPKSATGWESGAARAAEKENRLKRSKSISAFNKQERRPSGSSSPAVPPQRKFHHDVIYSAVEPALSREKIWAMAAAGLAQPARPRSASLERQREREAKVHPVEILTPAVFSPTSAWTGA